MRSLTSQRVPLSNTFDRGSTCVDRPHISPLSCDEAEDSPRKCYPSMVENAAPGATPTRHLLRTVGSNELRIVMKIGSPLGTRWEVAGNSSRSIARDAMTGYSCEVSLTDSVVPWYRGKVSKMSLTEALLIALRALRAHRLRSTLTMLGLIIGVSAVILLAACGQGVKNSVDARIEPVANNITIVPQAAAILGGPPAQPLTDADADALQNAPNIATVTPAVTSTASGTIGSTSGTGTLIQTNTTAYRSGSVIGTTDIWATTNNRNLTAGSFFDEAQVRSAARVVVLGPAVASTLFGHDPAAALDQTVQINHTPFRVIGVMQSYGQQLDNTAVMPLSTARRYVVGHTEELSDELNQITVQAPNQATVPNAMAEITHILDTRHHITNPGLRDFQVQSLGSRLQSFNQIVSILVLFTPAVAALSLLVGGIGVLNIMLVSVTERTREIGIRKAIGATNRAILEQFLIESTVLAGIGGAIGAGIGIGLSFLVGIVAPAFDPASGALAGFAPVLSALPVMVAFGISLAIGLIAGGYPAYRAARLLPIQALRYQ